MNDAILEVRGATFGYDTRRIFADLDLDVARGEVLTLLGPNGCGKSTLLRCIAGIQPLVSGAVRTRGEDLARLPSDARARRIGILFQDHSPVFPFRVLDIACMGRAPHLALFAAPSASDRALAEAALERVGMRAHRDRPYTELSGGERQLVLLARTLTQAPEVILLDEPTSHLDLKNQVLCLKAIGDLAAQGTTMIMSSHDPNHAFLFSARVALMHAGGTLQVGEIGKVLTAESLSKLYGLDIKLHTVAHEGRRASFCTPW